MSSVEVLLGMGLQERVQLLVVYTGERAARQRRQDVRMQFGARPGLARPPFGELVRRRFAAREVWAAGQRAVRCLAPTKPLRVREGHADRDRELVIGTRAGL